MERSLVLNLFLNDLSAHWTSVFSFDPFLHALKMEHMLVAAVKFHDLFAIVYLEFFVADDAGVVVWVFGKVDFSCFVGFVSQEQVGMRNVLNNPIQTPLFLGSACLSI